MDPECVLNEFQRSNRFHSRLKSCSQEKKSKNNNVTKTEGKIYHGSGKVNHSKGQSTKVSNTLAEPVKCLNRYYLALSSFSHTAPIDDYSTTTSTHTSGKIPTIYYKITFKSI